jgi:hypothetical protein
MDGKLADIYSRQRIALLAIAPRIRAAAQRR